MPGHKGIRIRGVSAGISNAGVQPGIITGLRGVLVTGYEGY